MKDKVSTVFLPTTKIKIGIKGGSLYVESEGSELGLGLVSHKMLNELEVAVGRLNQHHFPGNFEMKILDGLVTYPYLNTENI